MGPGGHAGVAEAALVLVLFADAAGIRARDLRREEFLPLRLLAVGLPLTMALGWLAAWPLLPGLSVWELALAAVILAPTDAALGQQALSNRRVPTLVRGGLSVESGLNDGLALPFFVLALAAAAEGHGHPGIAETFLRALLLSSAIGIAAGWTVASLLRWSLSRGWSSPEWQQFLTLVVPVIAYVGCTAAEGSGFIGAWVAGLAFGIRMRRTITGPDLLPRNLDPEQSTRFTERLGLLLASLSCRVFGAFMYIGWLGPRGLASLVFGLLAFEEHLPGGTC
ncbi:cation:proton antiporter [Streptomyces xanthophaeus]|uniref:cation:proton antiporter domain-containing protein n=1 Tax=Streptomyces xanthophaeus TaxID=67385 RepID=UPI00343625B0